MTNLVRTTTRRVGMGKKALSILCFSMIMVLFAFTGCQTAGPVEPVAPVPVPLPEPIPEPLPEPAPMPELAPEPQPAVGRRKHTWQWTTIATESAVGMASGYLERPREGQKVLSGQEATLTFPSYVLPQCMRGLSPLPKRKRHDRNTSWRKGICRLGQKASPPFLW